MEECRGDSKKLALTSGLYCGVPYHCNDCAREFLPAILGLSLSKHNVHVIIVQGAAPAMFLQALRHLHTGASHAGPDGDCLRQACRVSMWSGGRECVGSSG